MLEIGMQHGSLHFDATTIAEVSALAAQSPVVLIVTLNRPAILTPLIDHVVAAFADFGASDEAVIAALTGAVPSGGRLPFELPRSMAAVEASSPDVASDTGDPLFPAGHGLKYA